jgi:hypothetical protein
MYILFLPRVGLYVTKFYPNGQKPAHIHLHSTITKKNDNIDIDSTIAGSVNACSWLTTSY